MALVPALPALPTVPVNLLYIFMVPGVMIFVIMVLVWFLFDLRRFAPEAFVFRKCRKKDLPVILDEDIGSGNVRTIVGEKDKAGDPIFKHPTDKNRLYVDPTLLHNTKPQYWGNGLYCWHFASSQWQPLTTVNMLGLVTCKEVAKKYDELSFLPDRDLMAFAKMRRDHISHNVRVALQKYEPEWDDGTKVSPKDVVDAVVEYQEELKRTPLKTGLVASDAAFAMNPVTHFVQDLAEIKVLIEMKLREEFEKMFNIMKWAIAAAIVIGVIGIIIVAIMVLGK